ncbi:MAG TPA: cation diffusion facilitator family transporter [Bacteroidales bacterium]|nr:cation diffusion facilitator family transporter [Bacteroidales bacterium]
MKSNFEYPDDLKDEFERAKKIEQFSIVFLIFTAWVMYVTMGNSQAMKTEWVDDILSLMPPISFLIASAIYTRGRNDQFPYGYHRVVSIAYLCSAFSLFIVGGFVFTDALLKLIKAEHPTIGTMVVFGIPIWQGYIMILALIVTNIPIVILGRMKLPLARKLHEKNLHTDAQMNKADWMTALAVIFGIIGIGAGLWWADAVAAIAISFDILYDGFKNLKQAVFDLMNQVPKDPEHTKNDPLLKKISEVLGREEWIKEFSLRIREEGHVYFGEAFVVPRTEQRILQNIRKTKAKVSLLSWLIYDFNLIPVDRIETNQ